MCRSFSCNRCYFIFTLKINRVFGYITGISRKKAIKEINEHNSYTSDVSSGNITQDTGRKLGRTSKIGGVPITSKIPTSKSHKII